MPKIVNEITSGSQYTKTQADQQGQTQDSATRVFRVVLDAPGEVIDPQQVCQIRVGSAHPSYGNLLCESVDIRYDGDSRMAMLCTFQYRGQGSAQQSQDQTKPPDARPANWSISSSLVESPCSLWRLRKAETEWGTWEPVLNPVSDIIDGITELAPLITITITQYDADDPTKWVSKVGRVNKEEIALGSLTMTPHTLMLRSVQSTPTTENFQGQVYRGWTVTYEFMYSTKSARVHFGDQNPGLGDNGQNVTLGWDIAVPLSGFNVYAVNPAGLVDGQNRNNSHVDVYGQPLLHGETGSQFAGRIVLPPALAQGVTPLSRQRAMVRVFSYSGNGASQAPSAMPVSLNIDGTPRNTDEIDGARYFPIVRAYSTQLDMNFTQELGLRLTRIN